MAYSRYYRYKLPDSQKKMYDGLLQGFLERKTEIRVACPYDWDVINKVVYAVNFDHPELYYVDFGKISVSGNRSSCRFFASYYADEAAVKLCNGKLAVVVSAITKMVAGKTAKESALMVHDWLVTNCTYEECESFPNAGHSIVGALLYSKCVCEGYAKACKFLLDAIRVRCIVVTGDGIHPDGTRGGHAWNIVKLNDKCYHVDVTFDQLFANKYCSRAYFLLSEKEIRHDHSVNGVFELPVCTDSASVLRTVSGTKELLSFLESEYRRGVTHSEVRFTKGFTGEKLLEMMKNRMSLRDALWYSHIGTYWYGDYCRTFFVCWK